MPVSATDYWADETLGYKYKYYCILWVVCFFYVFLVVERNRNSKEDNAMVKRQKDPKNGRRNTTQKSTK